MARAEFSLHKQDRKRLLKDRMVRITVSCVGVSILGALAGMFIYLALMVIPLFEDAALHPQETVTPISSDSPMMIGVNDHGDLGYSLSHTGEMDFWALKHSSTKHSSTNRSSTLLGSWSVSNVLMQDEKEPLLFAKESSSQEWLAAATLQGNVAIFKPFINKTALHQALNPSDELKWPNVERYVESNKLALSGLSQPLRMFTFSVSGDMPTVVGYFADHQVMVKWLDNRQQVHQYHFPAPFDRLDQMLLTPDGQTLYLRSGSELVVAQRNFERFTVNDVIDLSSGQRHHGVMNMALLSGASSLLVEHQDNQVTQWFDVLEDQQRHLRQIRSFQIDEQFESPVLLLAARHQKGFYTFYRDGSVNVDFTTSEKQTEFPQVYSLAPKLAALSDNERFLVTYFSGQLQVAEMKNVFPEVSFSSLWQKVWYEHYPEPQYVWQTATANDETEAKFSLAPIAFGTLKATLYVMLFAVPMSIGGAIYTAYFMSPRLRRVVKPTVELMEALPTVIIGFLAGLWFAPIVETHLTAIGVLIVTLPVAMMAIGGIYQLIPRSWERHLPRGWHTLMLSPLLVIMIIVVMSYSSSLEAWLFHGDIRIFLESVGIDYDQRNALVVALAMGFAVIPTIFTIAEDAIFSVPKHLSDGSFALGATQWQTLVRVVLLTASPGIFSAIMMGFGRAVGETMIVLMATGNTPIMDWNILQGMRTLAATIAVEMPESEVGSSHFRVLFLAALLLLAFTFIANSLAEWVRQRLREKYRAL